MDGENLPKKAAELGLDVEVLAFAYTMQEKLNANAYKGGIGWARRDGSRNWKDAHPTFLTEKLMEEFYELLDEVEGGRLRHVGFSLEDFNPENLSMEAADLGNCAMFLSWVLGTLQSHVEVSSDG